MYRRVGTSIPPSPSSSSSSPPEVTDADKQRWEEIQFSLKEELIPFDDFKWEVASTSGNGKEREEALLKYVGGVDVSYSTEDPSVACGTIVVMDVQTLNVVYQDHSFGTPRVPYVAGFLAFREVPIFKDLLDKMKRERSPFFPQVVIIIHRVVGALYTLVKLRMQNFNYVNMDWEQIIMVDGNGILHPRGFGSACHLGVLANVPTIGVGKNLHRVDGLNEVVDELLESRGNINEDFFNLKGHSGRILGAAMTPTNWNRRPIFISIGHRISVETAIQVVKMTCKYRVPEPIRQADMISRKHIRNHDSALRTNAGFSKSDKYQCGGGGTSRFELNQIVDVMRRINMNNKNHRKGQSLEIRSHRIGPVHGRGSFSRPLHREIGACFTLLMWVS